MKYVLIFIFLLSPFMHANDLELSKEEIKQNLKECFSLNSSSDGHPDLEKVEQCMHSKKHNKQAKREESFESETTIPFHLFI